MTAPKALRRQALLLLATALALLVRLWAKSCRVRIHNDPRPRLRAQGRPYVYALLHQHQISAVLANDEPAMAAMVSRSGDGDLLVPSLRARRVLPVRGSGRRGTANKGGETALRQLIALNRGGMAVLLAVDGPTGPRGTVHGGIIALARASGALIVPVAVTAQRAWVLHKTWDHTEVPWPMTTLTLRFGEPIEVAGSHNGDELQRKIGIHLQQCASSP